MELFSGLADRSGARDLVDVTQKPQMSHGHRRRSSERVLFGISLARNQRQSATLKLASVQVTAQPSRPARDLLEWPQRHRPNRSDSMTLSRRLPCSRLPARSRLRRRSARPPQAQTKLKMVLNWKYQGPQGWFFLAEDKGYFKAEGLEITIDQGNGSATPIPLVASGTYDIGFGDINALIEFAAQQARGSADRRLRDVQPPAVHHRGEGRQPDQDAEGLRRQDARRRRQRRRAQAVPGALPSSPRSTASKVNITNMQPNLREQMLMRGQVDGVFGYVNTIRFSAKLIGHRSRQAAPLHQLRRLRHGPLFQRASSSRRSS